MRFIILGAGAIGGSLGGRLAHFGHDVVAIARGKHLAAIRERGLRIEAPEGTLTVQLATVENPAQLEWRPGDVVLLAVKTQDVAAALREVAAVAPRTTPIVCLTNGLEAERLAFRWFSDVHAVCVMLPAAFMTPGVVQLWATPVRGLLDVGRYPDGMTGLDGQVAAAFRDAGFRSEPRADILRWKRNKLLSNLGNASEALCGPSARNSSLVERAMAEGRACFQAAGLSWTSVAEDDARREGMVLGVIGGATRGGGSTWQSLARGAGDVECDYLNGEVVLMGRLHDVPTPVNELFQELIAEAARSGTAPGSMSAEEVAARLGRR